MAMSPETRRRVMTVVIVLIVVAFVLSTTACTSTTDESGAPVTDERLDASLYPAAMSDICDATDAQIAELPPPDESSRAAWADSVARALLDESIAFGEIEVIDARRDDHRAFSANTEQQSAQWTALAQAIADDDAEALTTTTDEIAALTLGRNDLAAEMGLNGCRERQIGG